MKTKLFAHIALLMLTLAAGCSKYTDIQPKGKNLLNRVSDLDLLLNYDYAGNSFNFLPQSILINDMYPQVVNVPNLINGTARELPYMYVTYDQSVKREDLTLTDGPYQGLYSIIANVSNIVIQNVDAASGDKELGQQLKAEAYVLRAYMHFLLVNIFAKAYDPATAEQDGGIPYVNKIDFEEINTKVSVAEVYRNMMDDINKAIDLNTLPNKGKNNMRVGKGFAYAVKARILLSMRDYAGALVAVEEALKINSTLEDHRSLLSPSVGGSDAILERDGLTAPDNLFYAYYGKAWPNTFSPSLEILNSWYEPGNIVKDSTDTYNYLYGSIYSGLQGVPIFFAIGYQQNAAGMTASDLYIMKAECLIRTGKYAEGMDAINEIRIRRIYPYTALTAGNEADAMKHLQKTSRIEFLFTWKNFVDIKRWNREGKYPVEVKRTINGVTYTLPADSPLWIFSFPRNATEFNPTLTQNY